MDEKREAEVLARGLRALATFANHAPLDLTRFARLNSVSVKQAKDLMQAYEVCGFAQRMLPQELYILTPMARNLVGIAESMRKAH